MRPARSLLFIGTAFIATAAAPAPEAQPSPVVDQILVIGDQDTAQMRREFIDSLAIPSAMDQLGRFRDPICPKVFGLKAPYGSMVENRMRRVARAARILLARERCQPNAFLFVVSDKARLMADLRRSYRDVFGDPGLTSEAGIRAVTDSASPSVAWQVLEYRSFDGRPMYGERIRPGSTDTALKVPVEASRIVRPLRVEFGASVMVIEAKSILGADLRQLADFGAMQLFAHTDPDLAAKQSAPTILTLLADAAAQRPSPLSVTNWDLAYLKALYSYSDMYRAGAHHGELARLMKRNMEAGGASPKQ